MTPDTKTDIQYFYASLAPRPLLLIDLEDRRKWPKSGFERVRKTAGAVYDLLGADDKLTAYSEGLSTTLEQVRNWLGKVHPQPNAQYPSADDFAGAVGAQIKARIAHAKRLGAFKLKNHVAKHKAKGPTKCFRHICYDYNWSGQGLVQNDEYFTKAAPAGGWKYESQKTSTGSQIKVNGSAKDRLLVLR